MLEGEYFYRPEGKAGVWEEGGMQVSVLKSVSLVYSSRSDAIYAIQRQEWKCSEHGVANAILGNYGLTTGAEGT